MLIGVAVVAVGMHDYNGHYASAITLGSIALIVLILIGVYGLKNQGYCQLLLS
jgi:hypothetical protein